MECKFFFHSVTFHLRAFLVCFTNKRSIPWVLPTTFLKHQKSKSTFFDPPNCIFGTSVGFWPVWCWLVVTPTQISTSTDKYQRIQCLKNAWVLIWRHELFLQKYWSFQAQLDSSWLTLNPRRKILHHNCVAMLQTRFVLFIVNFKIRCYGITTFVR